MQHLAKKILFIALIVFSYSSSATTALVLPHSAPQSPDSSEENLQSLIQVLENPQTRDTFIQQLKGLSTAQSATENAIIKEEGTLLLQNLADSLESLAHQFDEMTEDIKNIPTLFHWVFNEIEQPERRIFWSDVAWNILRIIATSCVILYLCDSLLDPARSKIIMSAPTRRSVKIGNLLALGILELLSLFVFVITAYFLTALFDPSRLIKLLIAAWVNAIVLAHILTGLSIFAINTDYKHYNVLHLDDNTIITCRKKITRFMYLLVYGYFILQSIVILELPRFIFEVLMLCFSTIIAAILITWTFRHRDSIATIIRGNPEKIHVPWLISLRTAIADIWPWISLAYIITIFLIVTLEIHHGVLFIINSTVISLLILAATFVALNFLEWLMQYFIKLQKNRIAVAPGFETQVKSYYILIKKLLRGIIYLTTLFALFYAWNLHPLNWLWFGEGHLLSTKILRIFTIMAVTFFIWVFCVSVIEYYLSLHMAKTHDARAPRARSKTLLSVSRHFLAIILITISGILIISELGVNIGPLLAGAGVLGLAVGFGSQRLVQDIINGIFILLDDTISVDDVIMTAGKKGVVEAISIRTMRLRDVNGDSHTIPFSAVDTITNQTKYYSYAMFNIKVGYRDNIDTIIDAIKTAGENLRRSPDFETFIWDEIDIFGVDVFTEHGMEIKGRIKTAPGKQGDVLCEFNRLVKLELDKRGISWPYQQHIVLQINTEGNPGASNPPV